MAQLVARAWNSPFGLLTAGSRAPISSGYEAGARSSSSARLWRWGAWCGGGRCATGRHGAGGIQGQGWKLRLHAHAAARAEPDAQVGDVGARAFLAQLAFVPFRLNRGTDRATIPARPNSVGLAEDPDPACVLVRRGPSVPMFSQRKQRMAEIVESRLGAAPSTSISANRRPARWTALQGERSLQTTSQVSASDEPPLLHGSDGSTGRRPPASRRCSSRRARIRHVALQEENISSGRCS